MPLNLIVTEEGRAALLNAQQTGTDAVVIAQAGLSPAAITATPEMSSLPGEIGRVATVGGIGTANDTIHVSIRDDSAAAYTLRSFALYLDDGTLFAVYGQADPILIKTAQSAALIAVDCIFADISAASLVFGATNFTDPDATTTRKGLIEIATSAEAQGGTDTVRAITPAALAAALLPLLLGRDGSGSGLDADLLDGQDSSFFTNIIARLGYTPVNRAGDTMTGQLALVGDPTLAAHAARKAYVDGLTSAAAILSRLLTVDGSGSGIDADLLDGQHASAFAQLSAFSTGSNANGRWWKCPDGAGGTVIEQQGRGAASSGQQTVNIVFPTAFQNTDYDLQLTAIIPAAGDYDNYLQEVDGTRTVNGVTVYAQDPSSGGSANLSGFRWRAKGY